MKFHSQKISSLHRWSTSLKDAPDHGVNTSNRPAPGPTVGGASETMPVDADEFLPTRRSLLSRLKDSDDQISWRKFFDTYWKLIYGVAIKAGLNDAEAQDVVQETVIAVARNIAEFKYDPAVCSFKGWLMQVTRSRIANQYRRRKRHPEDCPQAPEQTSGTALLDRIPDPAGKYLDNLWDEEWHKNLMDAALHRIKDQVDIRQYQMFDFYVLKQWPVRKVAQALNVSVGRVYLAKHRVSKLVKKEIHRLETRLV